MTGPTDALERPRGCPRPGVVPSFDAGWDAHRMGLSRATVEAVAADKGWATLGWDARQQQHTEQKKEAPR